MTKKMKQQIKISDVVAKELKKIGIDTVFGVTGGAVVHLFDSIERLDGIKSVFMNNEQAASYAVEAYSKAKTSPAAGIFTTGPGATNALTGLAAAWLDSLPCIFISGQVRSNQTINGRKLRQVGSQEVDIVPVVTPLTKYAVTIYRAEDIKYELQKAIHYATSGRPGPVWLDIPVDVQWAFVNENNLKDFVPDKEEQSLSDFATPLNSDIENVGELLKAASRPLIIAGYGTSLSGAQEELKSFIETHRIPCVTTWNMSDWLPSSHELNAGRPGLSGQRGANLAVQNCDLLIAIGSHLNSTIVGTRPELFARDANIIVVDIDANELEHIVVGGETCIKSDAKRFLYSMAAFLGDWRQEEFASETWLRAINRYKELNRIALDYEKNRQSVNSYYFSHVLSNVAGHDDIFVIDGGGTIVYSSFQSIETRGRQRLILSTGLCAMGSGLPESIGVSEAFPDRAVHCLVGDGSLPFNVQELSIISGRELPIKVFVFNNQGYVSIRTTQKEFLDANYVGSSLNTGLFLPEVEKIAEAFGLAYIKISDQSSLESRISEVLAWPGPLICEVMVSPDQEIVPRQNFASIENGIFEPQPLEDMHPELDRNYFNSLMIVKPVERPKFVPPGKEVDLLRSYPKSKKPLNVRLRNNLNIAASDEDFNPINEALMDQLAASRDNRFGESYFDGLRREGYGGYKYHSKYWRGVAKDMIDEYNLRDGMTVLEVGCAKGFLLHELKTLLPNLTVCGLDVSEYAVANAMLTVKKFIKVGEAEDLPFESSSFDLVISINTVSELSLDNCKRALQEITRVSKGHSFITLNSWRNSRERNSLMKWNITAKSNYSVNDWKKVLYEIGYQGDYYWFFAH
ncbi:MAG: thiamine pyrophosphate-binding protein [Rhodospirillaceae bacterium]